MTVKAVFSLVTEGFCDVQAHDKEQRLLQIHLLGTETLVLYGLLYSSGITKNR